MAPLFPSRSTPTTWKPTPGRRSPQNLTRKSVSLEFPVFPCKPEQSRCLKVQFSCSICDLMLALRSCLCFKGIWQSGFPSSLPGEGGSAWICSQRIQIISAPFEALGFPWNLTAPSHQARFETLGNKIPAHFFLPWRGIRNQALNSCLKLQLLYLGLQESRTS